MNNHAMAHKSMTQAAAACACFAGMSFFASALDVKLGVLLFLVLVLGTVSLIRLIVVSRP